MAGISIWQLVIVALIITLLFGTKKLRGLGGDLGESIKGFKKAISDDPSPQKKLLDAEFTPVNFDSAKVGAETTETPDVKKG